jgi:hypothetical protein
MEGYYMHRSPAKTNTPFNIYNPVAVVQKRHWPGMHFEKEPKDNKTLHYQRLGK